MNETRELDSTAEKIVQAAERLFAEKGYAAVSVRQITKAAGISNVGAVSYYFGGKRELYLHILRAHFRRVQGWAKKMQVTATSPEEQLKYVIDSIRMTHRRSPYTVKLLFREMEGSSEFFPEIEENVVLMQQISEEIIRRGIKDGVFRPDLDPAALTLVLHSIAQFVFLMPNFSKSILQGEEEMDAYFEQALDCFFRGVLDGNHG